MGVQWRPLCSSISARCDDEEGRCARQHSWGRGRINHDTVARVRVPVLLPINNNNKAMLLVQRRVKIVVWQRVWVVVVSNSRRIHRTGLIHILITSTIRGTVIRWICLLPPFLPRERM